MEVEGAQVAMLHSPGHAPARPIDVPMLWDGYTMARNGMPAKALGWTLISALIGGLASAVIMVLLGGGSLWAVAVLACAG